MSGWDSFLDWLGYAVCHQLPERTIHFGDHALFICARDTGLYAGFLLTVALAAMAWRRRQGGLPARPWQAAMLLALLYFAFDAVTSTLEWRASNDIFRFTSGLAMGSAAALLVCPLVHRLAWNAPRESRLMSSRPQPWLLAAGLGGACMMFLLHPAWLFRPAQVVLLLCFAGTLCYLNFGLAASLWAAAVSEQEGGLSRRALACCAAASPLLAAAEVAFAHWLHTTLA